MRKIEVKRVFLVDETHEVSLLVAPDFSPLPDREILGALFETGKDVWVGDTMYHMVRQNGQARLLRYKIRVVTQYEKSWYNMVLDALRRI